MARSQHHAREARTSTADPHSSPAGAHEAARQGHPEPPWAALIESLPAAFYLDRIDGTSIWVSPQIEEIIGCTPAEWASGMEAWADRLHPDDRARVLEAADEFVRTGSPESDEYRVVLPDGRVRWIHDRALLLRGEADDEPLVHGIIVDITEARASHEVAERAGRLFRALVENAGESVTIVNSRGTIVYQNPTMGRVIGRPPEWFAGRTPLDLMPPEDAARARDVLMRVQERPGTRLPGEFRIRHRDGSWRIVVGVATNLLDDPAVRGIVLNYRDVTDERRADLRMRDADKRRQSRLEHMIHAEDEDRTRIAAELHDDTIQVMTAALLELDRGDRHLDRGDVIAAREAFASARRAMTDATERTRRLTFELRPQLLDAAGLGPAVRDLADGLGRDTGASVTVHAGRGRFPASVEAFAYRALREVLATVSGHAGVGNVEIRIGRRRGMLRATVADDGRRRPELDDLAAVDERLRLAGGALRVAPGPGDGTTVELRIPLPAADRTA